MSDDIKPIAWRYQRSVAMFSEPAPLSPTLRRAGCIAFGNPFFPKSLWARPDKIDHRSLSVMLDAIEQATGAALADDAASFLISGFIVIVKPVVLRSAHQMQIFYSVIGYVLVLMVYDFPG